MATSSEPSETKDWDSNEEIKHFREYLRIPSVHPNIDYGKLHTYINIYVYIILTWLLK